VTFRLDGKTALITGAGATNGIGFTSARLLAEMGAAVFLTSLSERVLDRAEELNQSNFLARAKAANLTVEEEVKQLISTVVEQFSTLDILINNAGMTSIQDPMELSGEVGGIDSLSLENFKKTIDRNLNSAFLVTKYALPYIRMSKAGRIVMIASTTGPLMAMKHEVAYASAKAGMIGLTKSLALDEAAHSITVNAVSPGWIATDSQTEDEKKQGEKTPLGRSASAKEIAALVAWLSTSEASYITGQNIVVDGGNSIAEERN
jgi:3-oxoacyl-[acyl-carrier protein] reductase